MKRFQRLKSLASGRGVVAGRSGPRDPAYFYLRRVPVTEEQINLFTECFERHAENALNRYSFHAAQPKDMHQLILEQAGENLRARMESELQSVIPSLILSWLFKMLLTMFLQWLLDTLLKEQR